MSDTTYSFLDGGGQMGAEIRAFDWAATPLGPITDWPESLKIPVGLMLNSAFPKCISWGDEAICLYNDAFRTIIGDRQDALGRSCPAVWGEAWDAIAAHAARARAGESTLIEDQPIQIVRAGRNEQAWFTFCYSPVRDHTGRICGILNTLVETTAKIRAEQSARLRNRELLHRIKNTFAIVSVIVSQTYRSEGNPLEARERISRRLASLGQAQEVLSLEQSDSAPIRSVVDSSLGPYRQGIGRIDISGPAVELNERQVFALALALNELATNATKYGALSVAGGRVALSWRIERREGGVHRFRLFWRESGGPRVVEPEKPGFGSYLIRQALADEFEGTVEVRYPPEGLECELEAAIAPPPPGSAPGRAPGSSPELPPGIESTAAGRGGPSAALHPFGF